MAIMGYLRERMGKIVAGVIGLSLFAFIATEALKSGGSFFKGDNNELGSVGDEKIPLWMNLTKLLNKALQSI